MWSLVCVRHIMPKRLRDVAKEEIDEPFLVRVIIDDAVELATACSPTSEYVGRFKTDGDAPVRTPLTQAVAIPRNFRNWHALQVV